jgi:hypothetical protein
MMWDRFMVRDREMTVKFQGPRSGLRSRGALNLGCRFAVRRLAAKLTSQESLRSPYSRVAAAAGSPAPAQANACQRAPEAATTKAHL